MLHQPSADFSGWFRLKGESRETLHIKMYEGWNFNIGNYLFTTDTK